MASTNAPVSPTKPAGNPELTVSVAAVNSEPVELEATPPSPERKMRRGSLILTLNENDLTPAERDRRAQLIAERKRDPAVLVDIPKTPQAEELEKSGATAEDNVSAKKTAPKTS